MKPRLEPCDHTEDDAFAWAGVVLNAKPERFGTVLWTRSLMHDRRDAYIMHTRTHRQPFVCAVCWEFTAHEACVIDHEIRMRRPFHPDSLGALLAEALR